jgi:glucose uptake protein GlcU
MITNVFLLSVILGIIIARIQFRDQRKNRQIQRKTLKLLLMSILYSVLAGFIFYHFKQIDGVRFYLLLITSGLAVALFMLFERLTLKYWWMVIIVALLVGTGNYFFLTYKAERMTQGWFLVGCGPALGYLIRGSISRQWKRKETEVEE